MKFKVNAELDYTVQDSGTIILNIHALRTPGQTVLEEVLNLQPHLRCEELLSESSQNRYLRIAVPEAQDLNIRYEAIVDTAYQSTDHSTSSEFSIDRLGTSVLPYLYPSRYCQSDKLYRFAANMFGNLETPYDQVSALTGWINRNIEYLSGSTNSQTSAYDIVTEQAGVCRDFAHLGIALCRALTIPARYFTGYAYNLQPPDFHACFEAYIDDRWILFDATGLAPLNGLIKIATGRDAADTAVANLFGNFQFNRLNVSCEVLDAGFEPWYYQGNERTGISYL